MFLSWRFGHVAKWLDEKDKVNFKFHDVTALLTNNLIHILPNILRRKENQTMKFGQLIECKMENIFLEKLYAKCDEETSPRLVWVYLGINSLRFYTVCFCCMPSRRLLKRIKTKLQTTLFYLILSFLKKKKEMWN